MNSSAYSLRLLDYVVSISLGNNFLEVSESILASNYRAFYRVHEINNEMSFLDNILFVPISNDKLMQVFSSYYNQIKPHIDSIFQGTPFTILFM